ncbi:MAG TPA: Stp1/IreP family PP2C-type Ser/Thr phosphatase [Solirubrobacteraceae bacterium]|nr:Stp1/IreP family PP2C-type Ser/Thr phosphatase [Solirubrobacteraceae bacterium]
MLRIAEHFHASDLGRQRQGNEDNYYVRAPLFVVADGMGGAQAGEVASEMAVRAFEGGLPDGDPRERLVQVIERANRRIHERSRSDTQRAGMGTTLTAAYVADDAVVVAHVGDSRCYLYRGGDLVRLTRDHSLVGELVARGKLTEEQAEAHPQRSVITRALGPEPTVQVDLDVYPARPGDVFLVCSDGLTSMVHEAELKRLLESGGSLDETGRRLIAAANDAGGRDNITVVLFRLEQVDDRRGRNADTAATAEYRTFEDDAPEGDQGALRHDARASDEAEAEYRRTGTVALPALRRSEDRTSTEERREAAAPAREPPPRTVPLPDGARPAPRRGRRPRRIRRAVRSVAVALLLLSPVLVGGWMASRLVYFIGTDREDGRTITIYRGLPYELPGGVRLYERYAGSGVTLEQVPPARRSTFTDHKLRSRDDAEDLVIALERGRLE